MTDNICITCLKIGDKFNAEYVNKLYTMVRHQTEAPFFCFTDNPEGIDPNVNVVSIDVSDYLQWENWWAAWYKILLFVAPEIEKFDRKIFFDLDVIIHGDIKPILEHSDGFSLIYSKWKGVMHKIKYPDKSMFNSSVMVWSDNKIVYEHWSKDPKGFVAKYHGTDDFYHNEEIVRTPVPSICYSYRDGCKTNQLNSLVMRDDHALAILHQQPKNHELNVSEHPIIEYWNGKQPLL